MTRKSRRCWSKSIGEPGRRVRLYEARSGGSIMRSVFTNGKEDRKSLGHRGPGEGDSPGVRAAASVARQRARARRGKSDAGDGRRAVQAEPGVCEQEAPYPEGGHPRARADRDIPRPLAQRGDALRIRCAAVHSRPAAGSRLAPPRLAGKRGPGSRDRIGSRDPADGAELGHEGTDKGRAAAIEGKPAPRRPAPAREESEAAGDVARRVSPAARSSGPGTSVAQTRADRGRGNGTAHLGVVQL